MATNDTVQRQYAGITSKDIATLALGTSTTETSFSLNSIVIGSATAIAAVPAIISVPAQGQVTQYWDKGRPFLYQAWGQCTTGTSAGLTLTFYQVPVTLLPNGSAPLASGSVASCNKLATSTKRTIATTTAEFFFQAILQWNATSKLLHGQFSATINNLTDVFAAATSATTATAFDTELNFIISATLDSGNAANSVILAEQTIQPL